MTSAVESVSELRLNSKPTIWFDLLFGLLPVLMVAPQLATEFQMLWSSASTRYFVIPIVILCGFVAWHWRSPRVEGVGRVSWARFLIVVAVILFGVAVWRNSPWLAHFSYPFFFAGWALERFGSVAWPRVLGWTLLLATSLRLPSGWDAGVQVWLVRQSSAMLGNVLDGLGIPYLIQTDTFSMRNLEFSVTECCYGFFGVQALASLVVLMVLVSHRSLLVAGLAILSVPFWAIIQNVLLLLSIVLLQHHTGRDASQGVDHWLIQLAAFLTVAINCWISIWFVSKLMEPVPAADSQFEPEFLLLNWLLCWPQPDPFAHQMPARALAVPAEAVANRKQLRCRIFQQLSWVAVIGMVGLGVVSTTRWSYGRASIAALPVVKDTDLAEYEWKETFPPTFGPWRQLAAAYGSKTEDGVKRMVIDWQFDWLGQIVQLQLTFPYNQRPRFADRYESKGWQVLKEEPRQYVPKKSPETTAARGSAVQTESSGGATATAGATGPSASQELPLRWSELSVSNELGGRATALVAYHRLDGQDEASESSLPPSLEYQVVLFCESGTDLTTQQMAELSRGFQLVNERLQRLVEPQLQKLLGVKP